VAASNRDSRSGFMMISGGRELFASCSENGDYVETCGNALQHAGCSWHGSNQK
jgi:hypothetical protein